MACVHNYGHLARLGCYCPNVINVYMYDVLYLSIGSQCCVYMDYYFYTISKLALEYRPCAVGVVARSFP